MPQDDPIQRTAVDLWKYLVSEAGVDTKFFDRDIKDLLREQLKMSVEGDFVQHLKLIPLNSFVLAIFRVAEPYFEMLGDVLAMFELAAATTSDRNLQVEFNFNNSEADLRFDLEHFRAQVEVWKTVKTTSFARASGRLPSPARLVCHGSR